MKKKLTDDQAEMLAFFVKKGVFEQSDLHNFFSHHELWDTDHRIKTYHELADLNLFQVQHEEFIPVEGKNIMDTDFEIEYRFKGMSVTEDAKALLENYTREQNEIKRKMLLEIEQLESIIATNRSVQGTNDTLTKNIPVQNNLTKMSLGLAAVSVLFIIITVYQQCNDTTSKELKGIQEQIEKQSQHTEGLLQAIKKIGHDLKSKGTDSTKK